MGQEDFLLVGQLLPPMLELYCWESSAQERMLLQKWGVLLQHSDPGGCLHRATDSPHAALVHPALSLPESKLSACKCNLECWPIKGVPMYLAIFSCWTVPLVLFIARCYVGTFPSFVTLHWGVQLVFISQTSQR